MWELLQGYDDLIISSSSKTDCTLHKSSSHTWDGTNDDLISGIIVLQLNFREAILKYADVFWHYIKKIIRQFR